MVIDDLAAAIDQAKSLAQEGDLIVITGSLFTIGEARQYLTAGTETGAT
ncbi:MAG: hypothetical protein ACPL7R_09330 [Anaerolineae bacterium]